MEALALAQATHAHQHGGVGGQAEGVAGFGTGQRVEAGEIDTVAHDDGALGGHTQLQGHLAQGVRQAEHTAGAAQGGLQRGAQGGVLGVAGFGATQGDGVGHAEPTRQQAGGATVGVAEVGVNDVQAAGALQGAQAGPGAEGHEEAIEGLEGAGDGEEAGAGDVEAALLLVDGRAGAEAGLEAAQQGLEGKPGLRGDDGQGQAGTQAEGTLAHEEAGHGLPFAGEQVAQGDDMRGVVHGGASTGSA